MTTEIGEVKNSLVWTCQHVWVTRDSLVSTKKKPNPPNPEVWEVRNSLEVTAEVYEARDSLVSAWQQRSVKQGIH